MLLRDLVVTDVVVAVLDVLLEAVGLGIGVREEVGVPVGEPVVAGVGEREGAGELVVAGIGDDKRGPRGRARP